MAVAEKGVNYYQRYCGDYAKKTARLTLIQHGAYTLLLDEYYSTEQPLPADLGELNRICRAMTKAEQEAVKFVAEKFFQVAADGMRHNQRADEMIEAARPAMEASRSNGKKGGRPRKNPSGSDLGNLKETQEKPSGFPTGNPGETQDETTRARSPTPYPINTHTPSASARVSMVLRKHSIDATPFHPSVIALAEQEVDLETLEACCAEARKAKPNESLSVGYIVKKLEGWKAQAASVDVRGAQQRPKAVTSWTLTPQAMSAKARELGISDARPGETEAQFKARIIEAINASEAA
jgi:uncharacterized protein YdaU (DUF1376 family)